MVLTDIKLPDVVSLKVVSSLLQVNEDLPVVVISGEADEDVALQTVNHGAQDYLIKSRADASLVANKILEAMLQPVNINGFEIFVTPSIGITLYPIDDTNIKDLFRNADAAMYKAKDDGRNCYRFYKVDMNKHLEERMLLESKLRHAIENNEFELHYQPIFMTRP